MEASKISVFVFLILFYIDKCAAQSAFGIGVCLSVMLLGPNFSPSLAMETLELQSNDDWMYYTTIEIGTPRKEFKVVLDSASSDFWVPSLQCSEECDGKSQYDPSSSSRVKDTSDDQTQTIKYVDGSAVVVGTYNDTIRIGGITISGQTFGAAESMSNRFSQEHFDGILGLASAQNAVFTKPTVLNNMEEKGLLPQPVIGISLYHSRATIGGLNSPDYEGNITYIPMQPSGFFEIDMTRVKVGTVEVSAEFAIIDTGSSNILAPIADVKSLCEGNGGQWQDVDANCVVNCEKLKGLKMSSTIHGQTFTIPLPNTGELSGSEDCVAGIMGISDTPDGTWYLGNAFLENYYIVLDRPNDRVGFATPSHGLLDQVLDLIL